MATLASRGVLAVTAAGLALSIAGCGYVKRKDFDSEVARIREEVQTGDRNLATRIDSTNGRMDALERELTAFRSEYNVSVERMKGMLKFNVPV
ncbi:MAG: hypothetical protein H0U85_09670, partial [Gemmatimonadales bacterium]|nr:hypothetical protein [Gemmatimonadales bacterium]